jgi:hypothetical protein
MNFRFFGLIAAFFCLSITSFAQKNNAKFAARKWRPVNEDNYEVIKGNPSKPRFKISISNIDYNVKSDTWKFKILDLMNSRNSGFALLNVNANEAKNLVQNLKNIKIRQVRSGITPKDIIVLIDFPGMHNEMYKLIPLFSPPKIVADNNEIISYAQNTISLKGSKVDNEMDVAASKGNTEEESNGIFTSVQTPSTFPGGPGEWNKFLFRNLNRDLPIENGAPAGIYKVIVSFIVARDGSISDVKADNDPGYGTAAEAVRVIQKGPNWTPAEQNGRKVKYRHRQVIGFQITND